MSDDFKTDGGLHGDPPFDAANGSGILPCPFCGAQIRDTGETRTPEWIHHYVWCWRCCAQSGHYRSRLDAIKFWNQRSTSPNE